MLVIGFLIRSAITRIKGEGKMRQIKRVYTRLYRDNDSMKAYVEWCDGSRTEGNAEDYHGVRIPSDVHMGALFDRAIREGFQVQHETW